MSTINKCVQLYSNITTVFSDSDTFTRVITEKFANIGSASSTTASESMIEMAVCQNTTSGDNNSTDSDWIVIDPLQVQISKSSEKSPNETERVYDMIEEYAQALAVNSKRKPEEEDGWSFT